MFTKITSTEELQQIFLEQFYNKQNKITKASPNSVISSIGYGIGKTAQKVLAETARIESLIFPQSATGDELDEIARRNSIPPRRGMSGSSVYVRLVAVPGTVYPQETLFISSSGIEFLSEAQITIGSKGFDYVKCQSSSEGFDSNVAPYSIVNIQEAPDGHLYCINEYMATGGQDIEDDDSFRTRIQNAFNVAAVSTTTRIIIQAQAVNSKVLDVVFEGYDENRKIILSIATINGQNLTNLELEEIRAGLEPVMPVRDILPFGMGVSNLKVKNAVYEPIDVSMRVSLSGSDFTTTIAQMQQNIAEYFNFSNWKRGQTIEWEILLELCRSTRNVSVLPDQFFYPRRDIKTNKGVYPRIRKFTVCDLEGNLIVDTDNNLNPVYYPAKPDQEFINLFL